METVAVIADIHGNLPALAKLDEIAPDAVYCGGDPVGYGPWPNEVCRAIGHTHRPWIHAYAGVLFVNCGSVGKPKDGVEVRIERFEYDAEHASREVASAGLPGEFAEKLLVAA